jgi:hypothetical protein
LIAGLGWEVFELKKLGHLSRGIGAVPRHSTFIAVALSLFFVAVASQRASAQLCVQLNSTTYTQNFNSLAATGTSNTANTLPTGFAFSEAGGNITYEAGDGLNSTGNTYSFGTTGSSERALGEVTTASVQSTVGACFVNNTGSAIMSALVGYTGEQWRVGTTGGVVDRLDFQFSTNATAVNDSGATWTNVDGLDFTTPNNTSAAGPINGNSAANRTVFAPTAITPATAIAAHATFFVRWLPSNITGANDGLAIDDFLLGYVPPPGLSGDFNSNSEVDAADYVIWRKLLNTAGPLANDAGISPGIVNGADYTHWRNRFGISVIPFAGSGSGSSSEFDSSTVPEPASGLLVTMGGCVLSLILRLGRAATVADRGCQRFPNSSTQPRRQTLTV